MTAVHIACHQNYLAALWNNENLVALLLNTQFFLPSAISLCSSYYYKATTDGLIFAKCILPSVEFNRVTFAVVAANLFESFQDQGWVMLHLN